MEKRYGAPIAGGEKEVLAGFLDHYRGLMVEICDGLTEEQLRRPMTPSGTSLLGMVKHLAFVERGWFQERVANEPYEYPFDIDDDPTADFTVLESETAADVFRLYEESCERSRRALQEADLDALIENPHRSRYFNVRWIATHMLEEIARHAGHADIIRELIDGHTGSGYETWLHPPAADEGTDASRSE